MDTTLAQLEKLPAPLKGRISFSEVEKFLTVENLAAMSRIKDQRKKINLKKFGRMIHPNSRFDFWKRVFSCREHLDKNTFFEIWYDLYNCRGSSFFQVIDTPAGEVVLGSNVSDMELLASLPVTDFLLIDNKVVQYRYTQAKKEGWEMLRYLCGRRWQTLRLPTIVREAINNDQPEKFALAMDISGQKFSSFSLLAEILDKRALKIFRFILENGTIPGKIIPMGELCAYIVSSFDDKTATSLLYIIEELHPGVIREVKDFWGRNLLFYAVQNMETGWFHPHSQLTVFLLFEAKCDPEKEDHLGLSYKFITESLTLKKKEQQMRRRYGNSKISWNYGNKLRTEQPLEALSKKSPVPIP